MPTTSTSSHPAPARTSIATTGPVPGSVVVAVGRDDLTGALRYAVGEARTRSTGLHLVHMVRFPPTDGAILAEVWDEAVAGGRALLENAVAVANGLGPELPVSTVLAERGTIVSTLVEQGASAAVVVIQHRHLGRARRLVTHSVTRAVAAHVEAPVVAVPGSWVPRPTPTGCVVVGVKDLVEARALIGGALAEAARQGVPLRIVHAGQRHVRETQGIEIIARELGAEHPGVTVQVVAEDAPAIRLLVDHRTTAHLLVVGRRHHTLPGTHVGPVARAVLEDAACPVLLLKVELAHARR